MKNKSIIALFLIAISCGENNSKDELTSRRAEIITSIESLEKELAEIDSNLLALDTNKVEVEDLPLVSIQIANEGIFEHFTEIQGQISSKKEVVLRTEINGTIESLYISEGEFISKGEPVLNLSNSLLLAQKEELKEQLDFSKFLLDKQQKLYKDGIGSEIQLKEIQTRYNGLEKSMQTLMTQLNKTTLYAPFSGYAEKLFIQSGEAIGPANPVLQLVGINDLYITADVSENLLSEVSIGDSVSAFIPALNQSVDSTKITRIGKVINPVNRTVKIEAKINYPVENLVPNLMAVVKIRDYLKENCISISTRLISKNASGESFLKILNSENIVSSIPVSLGKQNGNTVELTSKLMPGTKIIDEGKNNVVDGQKVKVISR